MNYEKRFCEIRDFLLKHEYLHELEMLNRFESTIIEPYDSWFDEVNKLTDEQLIRFESDQDTTFINDKNLIDFMNIVKELIQLPIITANEFKLDQIYKRKMNEKKVHEIQTLKSFVDKNVSVNKFIDIGSGAGHLSQALIFDNNKSSTCIDMNHEYQKIGIEKINRWLPHLKDRIKFKQLEIDSSSLKSFKEESMILGLHSCGPLSTYIIETCNEHTLNLGCCYHKLKDEYNISLLSKKLPVKFSIEALTMAAKGHKNFSIKDQSRKYKVKKYRYTLHFLSLEVLKIPFSTLGNAKQSDYDGPFSDYALKYLPVTKVLSKKDLENYYQTNKDRINKVIKAGSLRAQLARLIEIYLLLDRVIYLRENNIDANMFELFDREVSPRNIAIFSNGEIN
jgi:hypothetical protein